MSETNRLDEIDYKIDREGSQPVGPETSCPEETLAFPANAGFLLRLGLPMYRGVESAWQTSHNCEGVFATS